MARYKIHVCPKLEQPYNVVVYRKSSRYQLSYNTTMIFSFILAVFLATLPVQAGLVSFAVPAVIKADDDITVMVTMNSEPGSVWVYNLVLSATDTSLPFGYLGGRGFAMIDLQGDHFPLSP